ncbi:MAG: fimbrillin family protein [Muribaculaceae bacterium]|nr:fimbrillin family protein [Muribaculaceae bacterium]
MKKGFTLHIIILTVLLAGLWSCVNDNNDGPNGGRKLPLAITMTLGSNNMAETMAETRANRADSADQWSFNGFQEGDMMGFYASGGNWLEGNYSTPFVNAMLTYQEGNGQFTGPNQSTFDPSGMKSNETFMYFPYSSTVAAEGMPLRIPDNGTMKCQDVLMSQFLELQGVKDGKDMSMFGEFTHGFAELIIMRGEGFNNPPSDKGRITAVISTGITHLKITYDPTASSWSCTPSLVMVESADMTQENARRWDAWQGSNYGITQDDPDGQAAWYVIIPTLPNQLTTVEYVELCDNDGYYQRVSSLKLMPQGGSFTKQVQPGWRYPMEITMKELVPTVNPFRIEPWGNNVDLTDQRKRGINDAAEFALWVRDYNLYLQAPDNVEYINNLLSYGDRIVEEGNPSVSNWHFYILSDLDLSNYVPEDDDPDMPNPYSYPVVISKLASGDILDGISTNLSGGKFLNHTITGLNKTFVGTLSGQLQNLDFEDSDIQPDITGSAGILAAYIEGGYVVNCNIDNCYLFNPSGPGGMISGSMNNGVVRDCTIRGVLISNSTSTIPGAEMLIGTDPTGDFSFVNNITSII